MNLKIDTNYLLLCQEKLNTLNKSIIDYYNLINNQEECFFDDNIINIINLLKDDDYLHESFIFDYTNIINILNKDINDIKQNDIDSAIKLINDLLTEINELKDEYINNLNTSIKQKYL
ncbi:MAG: hypothetical protein ACI31G_05240 [Bacilli bacterium]